MYSRAASATYSDAHLQEAASSSILVHIDSNVGGWRALYPAVLDVDSAS